DLLDRPQDPAGDDPPGGRGQQRGRGQRDQRVLQQVREGRLPLYPGAERGGLLERALAPGAQALGSWAHCPPTSGRVLQAGHQGVGDRDDERAAHCEQPGIEERQPRPHGQPWDAHSRYPLPTTVSISGGSPSLRRSRATVTETMLLNGSRLASPTCSSSSSALTTRPSAARSSSTIRNSLRGRDSAW